MVNPETVHDIVGGQAVKWLSSPFETADASKWGIKASEAHTQARLQINWMRSLVIVLSDDRKNHEQIDINPRTLMPFEPQRMDHKVRDAQHLKRQTKEAERSRSPMRKTFRPALERASTSSTPTQRQNLSKEKLSSGSTRDAPTWMSAGGKGG